MQSQESHSVVEPDTNTLNINPCDVSVHQIDTDIGEFTGSVPCIGGTNTDADDTETIQSGFDKVSFLSKLNEEVKDLQHLVRSVNFEPDGHDLD